MAAPAFYLSPAASARGAPKRPCPLKVEARLSPSLEWARGGHGGQTQRWHLEATKQRALPRGDRTTEGVKSTNWGAWALLCALPLAARRLKRGALWHCPSGKWCAAGSLRATPSCVQLRASRGSHWVAESRPRRWLRVAASVLVAVGCVLASRGTAHATGMSMGEVAPAAGTFALRLANYSSKCGSLFADIVLCGFAFVTFGLCAGTETAITTLWPWKVRELAQREVEQDKKKGMWSALRADIQRFMQTILIGATISGVISTALVTDICAQLLGPAGLPVAAVSVTLLQLVLCEIIPKSMAVSNAFGFAKAALPTFYVISTIVYPIGRRINRLVELLLSCFGVSVDASKTPFVSEDELDLILESAVRRGILETEEGRMISSVRDLDNKRVKDIMIPLVDMTCVDADEPISTLQEMFSTLQHSRIPVYRGRFDRIIGQVSMKALLKSVRQSHCADNAWETVAVGDICDAPFFVPETMSLLHLLQDLKEKPLAICVDEYGGTTGMVSLENVLEEIVGEIYDPDVERTPSQDRLRKRRSTMIASVGNGVFVMSGAAEIRDVSEEIGFEPPEGDYNSIGGLLVDVIDRIPLCGEGVVVRTQSRKIRFEVTEVVDERKVGTIRAVVERLNSECTGVAHSDGATPESGAEEDDEDGSLERVLDIEVDTEARKLDITVVAPLSLPQASAVGDLGSLARGFSNGAIQGDEEATDNGGDTASTLLQ